VLAFFIPNLFHSPSLLIVTHFGYFTPTYLQVRFGSLDKELSAIIEPILALPPQEFTPLLMQLSREELIARFGGQS
jgi:hypothetical protein